jgi:hypothetical protein
VISASSPSAARSRAQRLASPPTTAATADSPASSAATAWLIRVCWGMPNSLRWVRADGAPTAPATRRPGSGAVQLPWGTAMRSIIATRPDEPASDPAATRARAISSVAGASSDAVPTPTSTGVRGSRDRTPADSSATGLSGSVVPRRPRPPGRPAVGGSSGRPGAK